MTVVYGYCRTSTRKQKIQRQVDNIKELYPDAIIMEESYTGTTMDRPVWNNLYKRILTENQNGKHVILVFDECSRMSRDAAEGFKLYQEMYELGIDLVFIKERHLDTEMYRKSIQEQQIQMTGNEIADVYIEATNKVLMIMARNQIELAFKTAEHEVDFLHKRTSEGVRKAIADGKMVGRKEGSKITVWKEPYVKEIIRKKSQDFDGSNNDIDVMAIIKNTTVEVVGKNGRKGKRKLNVSRNTYYKYKREME